jgi:plastocyanin
MSAVLAMAATALAGLSGCGGANGGAGDEPTPKVTVLMTDRGYVPRHVRIEAGTRVTFANASQDGQTAQTSGVGFMDENREDHDRRNVFDLHTFRPGEAESVELDTPGRYRYYSSFSEIKGVIEVVPPSD